ncbi:Inner membrane protein yrbG [Serratia fonticola]|uniref:Inner membrane protein yrbG n=1 Tax=Serratia fonticola TaxID=47917 RepID=A0A4U9W939_SERFO|nr:Inner membrane protein yrbG [Serratia fonticola]
MLRRELPLMLGVILLCGYVLMDNTLSRFDGVLLLLAATGFILLMLKIARLAQREGNDSLTVGTTRRTAAGQQQHGSHSLASAGLHYSAAVIKDDYR